MTCLANAAKIRLILTMSIRVAKYNESEFQNLQDLKETERAWLCLSLNLVMLKNSSFWLFP